MTRWVLVGVVAGATIAADLLQTMEMRRHGEVRLGGGWVREAAAVLRRPYIVAAVGFMAVSFFAFLKLLSIAELSFAVPATAGSVVVETMLAKVVLKERVEARRWAGACLVACGVALLAL